MLQGGSESVRERILWIDAIKGFGIILVMLAHLTSISSSVFWYLCVTILFSALTHIAA